MSPDQMNQESPAHTACSIPCNLCGGQDVAELCTRGRDIPYLRTVACKACGLAWTDPRPDPTEVKQYYEDEYRLSYKGTYTPKMKHVLRAGRNALDRYARLRPHLQPGDRVLDCGAGGGEFLYLLKSRGFAVTGIEPNKGYGEFGAGEYGLDINVGFIQNMGFEPASFDVITIFHVLEHTEDPLAILRLLCSWLQPGGTLLVEVPNVDNVAQTPATRFHLAHLYSFNAYTLQKLGERAGLVMESCRLTHDRINLAIVFRLPEDEVVPPAPADCVNRQNAERVISTVRSQTTLSYLFSMHPYRRLFGRLWRNFREGGEVRGFVRARDLLDSLYRQADNYRENKQWR